uniref:Uncharacterized protein n=1 Tax=Clandestinovirus TaxID=2831644 RepID=A0A8F8PMG6_9VIRU|nr:hypothetical protein KOM_12_246 [Clandestinovirus]
MGTIVQAIDTSSIVCQTGNNTTSFYKPLLLFYADSANISGTAAALTVASTITIPAGILSAYGNALEIVLVGQTTATANTRAIGIRLGSLTYSANLETSASLYEMKFTISRYTSNTVANFTGVLTHVINTTTFGAHNVTTNSFASSQNLEIMYSSPSNGENTIKSIRIYAY